MSTVGHLVEGDGAEEAEEEAQQDVHNVVERRAQHTASSLPDLHGSSLPTLNPRAPKPPPSQKHKHFRNNTNPTITLTQPTTSPSPPLLSSTTAPLTNRVTTSSAKNQTSL